MCRCTRCDLFMGRTHVVPGSGSTKPSVLIVGEAPGASEDRLALPFVGRSGKILDRMLEVAGLSRERDVFIANVVRCRPPGNRNPRAYEIRACAGWLREQIRILDPKLVVTLGRFALWHFLPGESITRVQGEVRNIRYGDRDLVLYPLLHPAAIQRNRTRVPEYEWKFECLRGILAELEGGHRPRR